jgi:cytochrome c2
MKRHIGTKLVVGCIAVLVLMLAAGTGVVSGEAAAGDSAGAELFLAAKCNMCHGVASADIMAKSKSEKMLGPDLGGVTERYDAEWISKYMRKQVQKDEKDHKKEYKGTEEDLTAMIQWLGQQAAAPAK